MVNQMFSMASILRQMALLLVVVLMGFGTAVEAATLWRPPQ
ncbi:MAG: hypothetical protein FD130_1955 [Halothiobacillaceae bacterium]|nr:MAG: hypothetical protein FD130_1955 [Halothiobacillaceae bacterium]